MHPAIQDKIKELVNTILTYSMSVPVVVLHQASALYQVMQGIKVDFDKYVKFHDSFSFISPRDYREIQTLVLLDKKISAIKMLRTLAPTEPDNIQPTGNRCTIGLKEAKDAIEYTQFFNQPTLVRKAPDRW
jgi:hypothetical protein